MAELASHHRSGLVPRSTHDHIERSLSFPDLFLRRSGSSSMDVPGVASPANTNKRLLLTRSLPEHADAALSRTLLQQFCMEDQIASVSPRSSLASRGSWMPTLATNRTKSSKAEWPRGSGSALFGMGASGRDGSNDSLQPHLSHEDKRPVKYQRRKVQKEAGVSILSAALRGLGTWSDDASRVDALDERSRSPTRAARPDDDSL